MIILAFPAVPTIQTLPDLTLQRTHGNDTLVFVGTPVNPGFKASANYFLEACATGNMFNDPILIASGVQDTLLKITVSNLNGLLLKKFPADVASSVDLRIRSIMSVDAGTGAEPKIYTSPTSTVSITIYGLPRLDLLNSGVAQKIESALGNGIYKGYVKLDATKPFKLKNPDTNTEYGVTAGKLATTSSTGLSVGSNGWYLLNANTNVSSLTYSMEPYFIGLIGSATPNGWDSDQKMAYDAVSGAWKITLNLVAGEIKFRLNDGWAWNLGGTPDNLTQGGSNLVVTAGNYTIALTIINGTTGTCKIVKN